MKKFYKKVTEMNLLKTVVVVSAFIGSNFSHAFSIDYSWSVKHKCSTISPKIEITDLPKNTTQLSVKMVDHDMRSFDHGGGYIKNEAGFPVSFTIEEGALKQYKGPCPPNFSSFGHDYEITVKASNSSNEKLGSASKKTTFSRKTVEN